MMVVVRGRHTEVSMMVTGYDHHTHFHKTPFSSADLRGPPRTCGGPCRGLCRLCAHGPHYGLRLRGTHAQCGCRVWVTTHTAPRGAAPPTAEAVLTVKA
eukprot:5599942-Prymnesium_polylepis.1